MELEISLSITIPVILISKWSKNPISPRPVDVSKPPTWPVKRTTMAEHKVTSPAASPSSNSTKTLVLDTSVFIRSVDFGRFGNEYYTVPEVLKEVRDGKAREFLESLHYDIKTREPTQESYDAVVEFSKKTGDYPTLSKVDMKVLALAYLLETEAHGGSNAHLRKEPLEATLVQKPASNEVYLSSSSTPGQSAEIIVPENQSESNGSDIPMDRRDENAVNNDEEYEEIDSDDSEEDEKPQNGTLVGFGDFGSDDEDGDDEGWINSSNIKEYTKSYLGREESSSKEEDAAIKVSVLTNDFAMQNVLLQIGLHLTSADGVTIKRLQRWILRCFACFRICKDMTKVFCPECGNNTLQRIQCSVSSDGKTVLSNIKSRISTRGTKYTIPPPKGGTKSKNLILSASQIPSSFSSSSKQYHSSKESLDDFSSFGNGKNNTEFVVGHGKRNPNVVKSKPGKRKRRRV